MHYNHNTQMVYYYFLRIVYCRNVSKMTVKRWVCLLWTWTEVPSVMCESEVNVTSTVVLTTIHVDCFS